MTKKDDEHRHDSERREPPARLARRATGLALGPECSVQPGNVDGGTVAIYKETGRPGQGTGIRGGGGGQKNSKKGDETVRSER